MHQILLILFSIVSVILIIFIMLQCNLGSSKGSNFVTEFSAVLCNPSNSNNYITRIIIVLAFLFFFLSLVLGNISNESNISSTREIKEGNISLMDREGNPS